MYFKALAQRPIFDCSQITKHSNNVPHWCELSEMKQALQNQPRLGAELTQVTQLLHTSFLKTWLDLMILNEWYGLWRVCKFSSVSSDTSRCCCFSLYTPQPGGPSDRMFSVHHTVELQSQLIFSYVNRFGSILPCYEVQTEVDWLQIQKSQQDV